MITFMFSSWCAQKLVEGVCRTFLSQSTQITEGFCVSCGCRHTSTRFVQLFASLSFAAVSASRVGSGSGYRVAIFYTVQQQCRRMQTNEPSIDCNNPFPSHYPPHPLLDQLQSSDYSLKGNAKSFGTSLQLLHFCRLMFNN